MANDLNPLDVLDPTKPVDDPVHPDLSALAEALMERAAGPLTIAVAELAQLMEKASNVRPIPTARWSADFLPLAKYTPIQLVGKQLDRSRITLTVLGSAVKVWLAPAEHRARAGTGAVQLVPGVPYTLETTAEVWAYTEDDDAAITWTTEEYDLG